MFMWPVFIYPGMMMHGATQKLLNDPVTWKGCTSPSPFQRLAARCAMVDGITCIAFKRKKEENICKPCLSFLNATDKDVPLACGSSWQTLRLATRMRRTKKKKRRREKGGEGGNRDMIYHSIPFPFSWNDSCWTADGRFFLNIYTRDMAIDPSQSRIPCRKSLYYFCRFFSSFLSYSSAACVSWDWFDSQLFLIDTVNNNWRQPGEWPMCFFWFYSLCIKYDSFGERGTSAILDATQYW